MYDDNPGEIDFGSAKGLSYWELTVGKSKLILTHHHFIFFRNGKSRNG